MKNTNPLLTKALEIIRNYHRAGLSNEGILSKIRNPEIIHIGFGEACGSDRSTKAACQALGGEHSLQTANSVIFMISAGNSLTFSEIEESVDVIHQVAGDSEVLWEFEPDDSLGDDILKVTLIALKHSGVAEPVS